MAFTEGIRPGAYNPDIDDMDTFDPYEHAMGMAETVETHIAGVQAQQRQEARKKRKRQEKKRQEALLDQYSKQWRTDYPAAWAAIQRGDSPTPDMFDDTPSGTDTVADSLRKQRNRRRKKRQLAGMAAQMDDQAKMMQLVVFGGVAVLLVGALAFAMYNKMGQNAARPRGANGG